MEMRRWRWGGGSGEVGGLGGVVSIFGVMIIVQIVGRDVEYQKENRGIDGATIVFLCSYACLMRDSIWQDLLLALIIKERSR